MRPDFFCAAIVRPMQVVARRAECLLKSYGADNRIIYGTGQVARMADIETYCETLLTDPKTAYVDARSATNNCFTLRITRRA